MPYIHLWGSCFRSKGNIKNLQKNKVILWVIEVHGSLKNFYGKLLKFGLE